MTLKWPTIVLLLDFAVFVDVLWHTYVHVHALQPFGLCSEPAGGWWYLASYLSYHDLNVYWDDVYPTL